MRGGQRRMARRERRQNRDLFLHQNLVLRQDPFQQNTQGGGILPFGRSSSARRQGPIGLLIGLIAGKVQEKRHPEEKAFSAGEEERRGVGEQEVGYVRAERDEDRRIEQRRVNEWVDERRVEEQGREGEYQADGRRRVDGPPSYDDTVRGVVGKE